VFEQALAGLAADLGVERLEPGEVAMVGDDPIADIGGALAVGMRAILVLTGKVDAIEAEAAMSGPPETRPIAIAASLPDIVAALD
jgi:ribonucleotide monophosphatase NagD (HAD superfamily)